jgi:thimet oligopeptidase
MSPIRSEPGTDEPFDYRTVTPEWIGATAEAGITAAETLISEACAAAASDDATFDEVVGRIDRAEGDLWTLGGRTGFMVRVHPDAAVRAAGQAIEDRLNAWRQDLVLRDDIARAIRTYAGSSDGESSTGERRRLLDLWLRDLRRAGHGLPDAERAEIKAITERLVVIESSFQRNLDEWSDGIDLRREDLVGLPDHYIDRLGPGAEPGTLRVSLDYPDYYPFMEGSRRRDLRRILATKMASRVVEANRPILDETLTLRRRKAALLGYPSWAHFRIEPKMAGTPERVAAFHSAILPALQTLAEEEHAAMRQRLERDTGATDLSPWDLPYYDQRIRTEEHGVDPEEVSAYLPLVATIDGLLELTGDVFSLDYRAVDDARAWDDEVPLYEVRDRISAEHLGWFYLDLHPRPGKFGHAMAWPIRLPRRGEDGRRLSGISAIVANVPRASADDPGLLRHDDVVMLYHEFGHVLHEVLGTNATHRLSMWGVELDFPEAISQIMENWAWSPDILARVTRHHATGQPMPTDLAERLEATRNVDIGSGYLRSFGLYGDFDLRVHGPEPVDLDEAKLAADAVRLLPSIPDSFWPAAFAHIVADYDAGYYGYLWSLVYGDDMWSRFEAEGIASPVVGAAYRRELLERGATRDAEDMVAAFLGRPSTNEAFLRRTGIALSRSTP